MRGNRAVRWLAVSATAVLVAMTAAPASAAPPSDAIDLVAGNIHVAPNGPERWLTVFLAFGADNETNTITFDHSGIAGIATFEAIEFSPYECATTGTTVTCESTEPTPADLLITPLLFVTAKPTAAPGSKGTVKITVSVPGGASATAQSVVTVAEGVDLVAGGSSIIPVAPGATFARDVTVGNEGPAEARGAVLFLLHSSAAGQAKRYNNCLYGEVDLAGVAVCTFTETLTAGQTYKTSDPYRVAIPADTWAPSEHGVQFLWFTPDDWRDVLDGPQWPDMFPNPTPGTDGPLTLVPTGTQASIALPPQTDIDGNSNVAVWLLDVKGDQRADFAAIGATVSGAVGAAVPAKVGVKNNGPAAADFFASLVFTVVRFKVPEGTTVTTVSEHCAPAGDREFPEDGFGTPGAREYVCMGTPFMAVGASVLFDVTLRLDRAHTGTSSAVTLRHLQEGEPIPDLKPANDTAAIVVTTTVGNGGSLPITGANVGLMGAAGALLLILGAAGVVIARRRRVQFTT